MPKRWAFTQRWGGRNLRKCVQIGLKLKLLSSNLPVLVVGGRV